MYDTKHRTDTNGHPKTAKCVILYFYGYDNISKIFTML